MNFLNHLWPWKELNRLREDVEFLKRTLEHEQTSHNLTRASLQDHKLELIDHRARVAQGQKDIRKLATILHIRGGMVVLLMLFSLSAFGQPILRQPLTTNTLALAPSTAYFLGWDGTTIDWEIPPDGLGTNYWNTNASFIFPIPHLSSSNDLGWWNTGGDVSVNATNNDKLFGLNATNEVARMGTSITNGAILNLSNLVSTISQNATNEALLIGLNGTNANTLLGQQATNNDTVVSNGVLAHTITMAGTATGLSFTPSGAQTLSSDPSFTGKIVASPIVTNLFNSGDQYKTNGSISSTAYDIMASNNLGSFSASSGLGTFTATSGAAFKTPTNTPAIGQQIESTATDGSTAYKNPHYLSTIMGGQYVMTAINLSSSRYCPLWGYQNAATTATENAASTIVPSGTFTNLYVKWVGLGTSTNMTITLMTNGVASNLAVTIIGSGGANVSGVDTTHAIPIPDQGAVSFRIVGNNPTVPAASVLAYFAIQLSQ